MPLPLPRPEMALEEFQVMPHRLGWKHEYWDGMARLSPSHTAVAHLRLLLKSKTDSKDLTAIDPEFQLRNVRHGDEDALIHLHRRVFDNAVEYAGHDEASYGP